MTSFATLELLSLDKRREALETTTTDLDASEVPLAEDNADDDDDVDDDVDDANVGSQDTDDESVRAHDEDSRSGSLFHAPFGAGARVRRRVFQPAS